MMYVPYFMTYLFPGHNHGDSDLPGCSDSIDFLIKGLLQNVSIQENQRIHCLILC